MLINIIDKNCAKIILLSIMSPGRKYNRKEIQEWTKLNNVPLDYSLSKLVFFKLINENKKIYSLNLENSTVKNLLEEREILLNLPLEVQFILIELLYSFSVIRSIRKVILFGSYSKLIFTENSDIDLAVIFDDKTKNQTKLEKSAFVIANKISRKYRKEIELHFFKESDLKHKEDPLIKDITRNGKILV